MTDLSALVARMKEKNLLIQYVPGQQETFDRLAFDSRDVGPNDCFIAISGGTVDGHLFIDKAVINGAVAIVCEAAPAFSGEDTVGAAVVHVRDSRAAAAEASSMMHGDPGKDLLLAGVTGTNGKTTTSSMIRHLFEGLGRPSGLIGTTGYSYSGRIAEATHTTPDAGTLYSLLGEMRDSGCEACVMELSSHALDQNRVVLADIDIAVFTNLTRDHLDYHGTILAYETAKKKLFDELPGHAVAIVNMDDAATGRMVRDTRAQIITYGASRGADVRFRILQEGIEGLRLQVNEHELTTNLTGAFNAYNIAAAYSVGVALDVPSLVIKELLQKSPPIPGRFELIRDNRRRAVIVDYAHTPDALERALQSAGKLVAEDARLWCVFGCGGDRDTGKRPLMGSIAERLADIVVLTSDNPRSENPEIIIEDILSGMTRPEDAIVIIERGPAIRATAERAAPGDVVLIAGKGHENYQVLSSGRIPFDDRKAAERAFGGRNADRKQKI